MYAIVQVGSDQYKVSQGDVIEVDRMSESVGSKIKLEDVLMVSDGTDIKVGQPTLSGANVEVEVIEETMADKVFSFKYRRRKAFALKKGHRAKLTALRINKITV